TVVFFVSDSEERVPVSDSLVFRTSFTRSRRDSNEFAVPGWSEDFLVRRGIHRVEPRPWRARPVVSWCGYITLPEWRGLRGMRNRLKGPPPPAIAIRASAVKALSNSRRIKANVIVRDRFWGGTSGGGHEDWAGMGKVRQEFVDNLLGGDYALCVRGAGNFSYRFYEALSAGRIPVLVDTDCVLPYD